MYDNIRREIPADDAKRDRERQTENEFVLSNVILAAKTQIRMKKHWVISYPLSAQRRLCSDWADAQTDPSLRWAQRLLAYGELIV